jgi:Trk-type K+ transport system membrane component
VHPLGTWLLSLLMMGGRLEIFPVVIILRRGFWR